MLQVFESRKCFDSSHSSWIAEDHTHSLLTHTATNSGLFLKTMAFHSYHTRCSWYHTRCSWSNYDCKLRHSNQNVCVHANIFWHAQRQRLNTGPRGTRKGLCHPAAGCSIPPRRLVPGVLESCRSNASVKPACCKLCTC